MYSEPGVIDVLASILWCCHMKKKIFMATTDANVFSIQRKKKGQQSYTVYTMLWLYIYMYFFGFVLLIIPVICFVCLGHAILIILYKCNYFLYYNIFVHGIL